MNSIKCFALVVLAAAAAPALAQSTIDPANKFAWSENCGWTNWADAGSPSGTQAVLIWPTFLSGFAWGENIGYINFGDGSPTNGIAYANVNNTDFGVNVQGNNDLSGLAWGENVGWINFNTAPTLTAFGQQARIDMSAQRFRGYAWAENIGWINLDDATHYVGFIANPCAACAADYNQDGGIDGADVSAFFADWEAGTGCSDVNQDGGIDGADVGAFFAVWEAGGC